MNWITWFCWTLIVLGFLAGGFLYWEKVKVNPLILGRLVISWFVKAWPALKETIWNLIFFVLKSSPETQARAREESRQRNEPGKGRGPER